MSATEPPRDAAVHPDDDASEAEQREAEALARALEEDPRDHAAHPSRSREHRTAQHVRDSATHDTPPLDAQAFERVRARLPPPTASVRARSQRRTRPSWIRFTGATLGLAASVAAVWLVVRAANEPAARPGDGPAVEYALVFTAPLSATERPLARIERMLARYAAPRSNR